jgi:hypothetical protein
MFQCVSFNQITWYITNTFKGLWTLPAKITLFMSSTKSDKPVM